MNFTLPTTKAQMYTTLQEIFNYYRRDRQATVNMTLQPLTLERLTYTPKTDEELEDLATEALSAKHVKESHQRIDDLYDKIDECNAKIAAANAKYDDAVEKINLYYDRIEEKLENQSVRNGTFNSTVLTNKLAELETERATKLTEASTEKTSTVAGENSKITSYQTQISNNGSYFLEIHGEEINAKINELKKDEEKLQREIFKYNNALDEKEQINANAVKRENADLQVKLLQVSNIEFTKEQLIDMGYYTDVVSCVCGYFDTLTPLQASQQITQENKLVVYLDSFYEQVCYLYHSRISD